MSGNKKIFVTKVKPGWISAWALVRLMTFHPLDIVTPWLLVILVNAWFFADNLVNGQYWWAAGFGVALCYSVAMATVNYRMGTILVELMISVARAARANKEE